MFLRVKSRIGPWFADAHATFLHHIEQRLRRAVPPLAARLQIAPSARRLIWNLHFLFIRPRRNLRVVCAGCRDYITRLENPAKNLFGSD
jgi:hypothetical protein